MMDPILLAIIAMVLFGTADIFAKKSIHKYGPLKTLFHNDFSALAILVAVFFITKPVFELTWKTIGIAFFAGLVNLGGYSCFYKALHKGKIAIISPIASCYALVTIILGLLFLGETYRPLQFLGVAFIIAGIILSTIRISSLKRISLHKNIEGIGYAFWAMLFWGIFTFLFDPLTAALGVVSSYLLFKVFRTLFTIIYVGRNNLKIVSFNGLISGVLDSTGFFAYLAAISQENTILIAPITAAFPMVTVVLAHFIFKDKIGWIQYLGIISIIIALALISI